VRNNAGEYSLYGHMRDGAPLAQMGQQVWPGDTIGHVGSTGACTTGPHLHYSVLRKGATVSQERPEGGKIGVKLNETNTIDPARYDVALYLDQTLRAQQMMPGPNGTSNFAYSQSLAAPTAPPIASDRPGVPAGGPPFNDRFGNWQSPAPDSSAFAPLSQSKPGGLPALILEQIRREKEQNIAQPQAIPVGANRMPTVPFVSPDDPMSPDHPASFDERFVDPSSVRRLSSRWIASFGAEKHSRDQAQVTQAG